jgi:hypothetical protein
MKRKFEDECLNGLIWNHKNVISHPNHLNSPFLIDDLVPELNQTESAPQQQLSMPESPPENRPTRDRPVPDFLLLLQQGEQRLREQIREEREHYANQQNELLLHILHNPDDLSIDDTQRLLNFLNQLPKEEEDELQQQGNASPQRPPLEPIDDLQYVQQPSLHASVAPSLELQNKLLLAHLHASEPSHAQLSMQAVLESHQKEQFVTQIQQRTTALYLQLERFEAIIASQPDARHCIEHLAIEEIQLQLSFLQQQHELYCRIELERDGSYAKLLQALLVLQAEQQLKLQFLRKCHAALLLREGLVQRATEMGIGRIGNDALITNNNSNNTDTTETTKASLFSNAESNRLVELVEKITDFPRDDSEAISTQKTSEHNDNIGKNNIRIVDNNNNGNRSNNNTNGAAIPSLTGVRLDEKSFEETPWSLKICNIPNQFHLSDLRSLFGNYNPAKVTVANPRPSTYRGKHAKPEQESGRWGVVWFHTDAERARAKEEMTALLSSLYQNMGMRIEDTQHVNLPEMKKAVPKSYVCYRCMEPGHYIQDCHQC